MHQRLARYLVDSKDGHHSWMIDTEYQEQISALDWIL